jgi:integrase
MPKQRLPNRAPVHEWPLGCWPKGEDVNTAQVEAILAEARSLGGSAPTLVAFFGCLYYAGLRPSEASSLRRSDCWLPRSGWGRLVLSESTPRAGALWTDDGQVRENRGLKRRGEGETRPVPIPPELVQLLNQHIAKYRIGPKDRLFIGARGGDLSVARPLSKAASFVDPPPRG